MTRPAESKLVNVAAELAAGLRILSRHRYGAILVWDPITTFEGGVVLDALVSRQLIVAIFSPESLNQLRRGVTVIRGDRIERAAMPLTWNDVVELAVDLAPGIAIAVDEQTGGVRTAGRKGQVEVFDIDDLAAVVRRQLSS